jgi:hypothetical protein
MAPTSVHVPQGDSELSLASPRLRSTTGHTFSDSDSFLNVNAIEDSDEEDEAMELDFDEPDDEVEMEDNLDDTEPQRMAESEGHHSTVSMVTTGTQTGVDEELSQHAQPETEDGRGPQEPEDGSVAETDENDEQAKEARILCETTQHGSPVPQAEDPTMVPNRPSKKRKRDSTPVPGPLKARVVVTDVAYITYRAVLYYVRPFASLRVLQLIWPLNIALYGHDRLRASLVQFYQP